MVPAGVEWKDKTVAVIGTGSSAIQIVPQIQKSRLSSCLGILILIAKLLLAAAHLTSFMRSTTW